MMPAKKGIHALGMGCWQIGGESTFGGRINGYGDVPEDTAMRTVRAALDGGIRFFDTASAYGKGRSEEILGRTLGPHREHSVICTKYGAREDETGRAFQDFSHGHLAEALSASLKRLNTDRIDILLLHNPPDDTDWSIFDRTGLEDAVHSGRIGAYGISARSVHGARRAVESNFGTWIEVTFNALDRRAVELHDQAQRNGQRLIARAPLASGLLSDKYLNGEAEFAKDDIRSTFPADQMAWSIEAVRSLRFLADLPGGVSASALRYAIHHPAISVTIPGMREPHQVARCIAALELGPLPSEVIVEIERRVPEVFHRWR